MTKLDSGDNLHFTKLIYNFMIVSFIKVQLLYIEIVNVLSRVNYWLTKITQDIENKHLRLEPDAFIDYSVEH